MRKRPMSTLIFGILSIGYALMSLAGPLMSLAFSQVKSPAKAALEALKADPTFATLNKVNTCLAVALGLTLLASGIGLLLLQNWARLGLLIYSIVSIVYIPIMSMLMWPFTRRMFETMPNMPPGMANGMAVATVVFGLLIGVGYAALLLFFMTRSNVIDACQPEQAAAPV